MSVVLSVLSFLGNLFSFFTRRQEEKIGAQTQQLADDKATVQTLVRERDAATESGDAESAASRGQF